MAKYDLISKTALLKHLDMAIECKDCPRNADKDLYKCVHNPTSERCSCSDIAQICNKITEFETFADVQPVDRWTSVKDKLPNKCGYYLVWFSYTCQDVDDEYYCEDFGKAFYFNSIIQEWDVKNIDIAHKPKVLYWQQVIPPTKEANTK